MSTPSDVMAAPDSRPATPSILSVTRPFYWSVRRELWEHRSVYVAPLAVAAVLLFGFLLGTIRLPADMRAAAALDLAHQAAQHTRPYHFAAFAIMLTTLLVGVVYSLGALHGERRDRSILFWKSLPVSDLTTVLAKAAIPLVGLPVVGFAIIIALQLSMLLWSTAVLLASGVSAMPLWTLIPLVQMSVTLLYGLAVAALWYAPIWGWLLLVSGWARRVTFLWAFLPPIALCVVERIAFHTSYFASLLGYRLIGVQDAFVAKARGAVVVDPLAQIDLVRFLSLPGLWAGLAVAAAFLAVAVWQRRYREPI